MLKNLVSYLCFLFLGFVPLISFSAGFRIHLENASDLGNAFAGGAALIDDASINASNAAGLSFLHQHQWVVSADGVLSNTSFEGIASAPNLIFPPDFFAQTKVNSGSNGIIPALYFAYPIYAQWDIGLSINEPFGLGLNFGENSDVRYTLIKASQLGVDIGPSIAYRVNEHLSLGIGPNFQHYSVQSALKVNTYLPDFFTDSRTEADADGWNSGYHLGTMYVFFC